MSKAKVRTLTLMRKAYGKAFGHPAVPAGPPFSIRLSSAEAGALIFKKLEQGMPLMVSRFGSVELECVLNYMNMQGGLKKYTDYITGKTNACWWLDNTLKSMSNNAGFFPATEAMLEKFSRLMLDDMQYIDILGSWRSEERFFDRQLSKAEKVNLPDLEPYYSPEPWSRALKKKKVLVIHPFEESIIAQYQKRRLLFKDDRILPDFELKTIKAVQSIANNCTGFSNWFEALDSMKNKTDAADFDIAIIGCGAYGMPLAAHVKRSGKMAVHLGGATQLLFGIMGKRWESNNAIMAMLNQHWTRPSTCETPCNFDRVEGGTYW